MTELPPPPPVPPDLDLRSYPWFSLPVAEVTKGRWWLTATPSARGVMLTLLCEAWHQIPAASLPNDRRSWTKLGQVPSKTGRLMAEIMSEWVLCSDGRLYHPMLAKIAAITLETSNSKAHRTQAARAQRAANRAPVTDDKTEEKREE